MVMPHEGARVLLHSVQALRAVAALLVFVFHIAQSWCEDFSVFARNIFPAGSGGVDIFFVISGFIMCFTTWNADRSPINFAIKRLARIAPLYYALTFGLFAVALLAPTLLSSTTASFEHLIKSLLFLPHMREDGQIMPILFLGWTLNYEMFFYVVFALALLIPKYTLHIVAVVMTALVVSGFVFPATDTIARFYTNDIILEFVFGCLIFSAWRRWPELFANAWPLRACSG